MKKSLCHFGPDHASQKRRKELHCWAFQREKERERTGLFTTYLFIPLSRAQALVKIGRLFLRGDHRNAAGYISLDHKTLWRLCFLFALATKFVFQFQLQFRGDQSIIWRFEFWDFRSAAFFLFGEKETPFKGATFCVRAIASSSFSPPISRGILFFGPR